MKFLLFFLSTILFFFCQTSAKGSTLNGYPLENPHEIALSETQKTEGKSKILFSQDPVSYYYILVTPPLFGNTKNDFDYSIDSKSFVVMTKSSSKSHYEAVVNFIRPIQKNLPNNVEIESHGTDGTFILTLRISKTIPKDGASIKTFYKPTKLIQPKRIELGKDDYGIKGLVDSMNKNSEGPIAKTLIGVMNGFNEALSNPNMQEKFNQTYFSTDEVAKDTTKDFNQKLQEFLAPLSEVVDEKAIRKELDMPNKEEFAQNANDALDSINQGDTEGLQNLLKSIDTEKIKEDGKKASKKQMKDKAKKKKTNDFISKNKIKDKDAMQKDSKKDNEKNQQEKKDDQKEKKKQAEKDKVLQDATFNF